MLEDESKHVVFLSRHFVFCTVTKHNLQGTEPHLRGTGIWGNKQKYIRDLFIKEI